MHEMSLALEVCDIAQRAIGDAPPGQVVEVAVDVGDEAGIDADNFEFCLAALLQTPPFRAARPVINRLRGDILRVSHIEVDDECL